MKVHARLLSGGARRQRHKRQQDHAEEHEDHPAHREFPLREQRAIADQRENRRRQQPRIKNLVENARHPVVQVEHPRSVNALLAHVLSSNAPWPRGKPPR